MKKIFYAYVIVVVLDELMSKTITKIKTHRSIFRLCKILQVCLSGIHIFIGSALTIPTFYALDCIR